MNESVPVAFPTTNQSDMQLADRLLAIYSLILIVFGTPCNLLCCLVYFQKENRSNSIKLVFGYLAILDTIVLYTFNLNYVVREFNFSYQLVYYNRNTSGFDKSQIMNIENINIIIIKKNLEEYSLFMCRLLSYIAFSTLQASSWVLAFGSLNRYLLISKITRFQFICKRSCTVAILLSITCLIFFANIHILWMNGFLSGTGSVICYRNKHFSTYMLWYQRIHLCIYSALPTVILFIFNTLLMRLIFASKKRLDEHRRRSSTPTNYSIHEKSQNERFSLKSLSLSSMRKSRSNSKLINRHSRKLTLSLILVTISYFVLTFPSTVIFSFFRPYIEPLSLRRTLSLLFTNLSTTIHAIRFFIYYFCSIDFRNEFYNVFSCKQKCNLRLTKTGT